MQRAQQHRKFDHAILPFETIFFDAQNRNLMGDVAFSPGPSPSFEDKISPHMFGF